MERVVVVPELAFVADLVHNNMKFLFGTQSYFTKCRRDLIDFSSFLDCDNTI